MKKYRNVIILGVFVVALATFFIVRNVNFRDSLFSIGYYDEKVSIAYTADVHGHIIFDGDVGSYYSLDDVSVIMGQPHVKHFVNEVKKENENTLLLDGGDMFHGTNEANVEKGKGVVDVANLMGYNAGAVGNHDFDYGTDRLLEIKSQLNYPLLSANIYKDGELVFDEYKIEEIGGKKIGIIGLSFEYSLQYTNSKEHNGWTIENPIDSAKRVVEKLKGKVDSIIVISHCGEETDKEIAQKVNEIDAIFSAHNHILSKTAKKIGNTYLLETGGYTTHMGLAELYFKGDKMTSLKWSVKTSKDKSLADKEVEKVAEKYHEFAIESTKEVVGKAEVNLNGIRSELRSKETNLANLLTDAMRETAGADITLMNGGGIRESIPKGDINLYKIGKVLPFSNSLVLIEVKGQKIYDAIERGLRVYPSNLNGGFLQVSGINYTIDGSKTAGNRLVSVEINGKPLDKDKYYKVATNDYLYNGGDGYEEFEDAKLISMLEPLKDVLAKYLREKGTVSSKEEGRIKVVNERYK